MSSWTLASGTARVASIRDDRPVREAPGVMFDVSPDGKLNCFRKYTVAEARELAGYLLSAAVDAEVRPCSRCRKPLDPAFEWPTGAHDCCPEVRS